MCSLRGKNRHFFPFFNYPMLMRFLISCTSFSMFTFHWGLNQNTLLPLHITKPRRTNSASAPFMKYLFHTDACLWVMRCCQILIAALLLHYNWDTSRGDMNIWKCVHLNASAVNYTALCVLSTHTLLWGAEQWLWVSPYFATATPCGVSHPDWPPQYGMSQNLSSKAYHGSSL